MAEEEIIAVCTSTTDSEEKKDDAEGTTTPETTHAVDPSPDTPAELLMNNHLRDCASFKHHTRLNSNLPM